MSYNSNQPSFSRQAGGIYGPAFSTERVDAAGCAPKQSCCGLDNYTDAFGSGDDDDEGFEIDDRGGRGVLPICRKRKPCRNPPKKQLKILQLENVIVKVTLLRAMVGLVTTTRTTSRGM